MSANTGQTRGSAIAVVKAAQMAVGSSIVGAGASAVNDNSFNEKVLGDIKDINLKSQKGIMSMVNTMQDMFMFDKEAFRRQRDQATEQRKEKQLAASNTSMDRSGDLGKAAKDTLSLGPALLAGLGAVAYFARELNVDAILRLPQQLKSIKAMATFAKGVGTIGTLGFGPKILDNLKAAAKSFKLNPNAFSPKNIGFLDKIKDFFKPMTDFFTKTQASFTKQLDSVKQVFSAEGKVGKLLGSFGKFFDDAFRSIQVTLKPITDTIRGVFGSAKEGGALAKLFAPLKAIGRTIGKLFLPVTLILGIFDGVSGFMKEYENTGSIVDGIRGAVVGIVDGFIGSFVRLLTDLLGMALEFLGLENLGQFIRNFGEDVTKFFNKTVGGIVDFIMGIFTFDGERILGGLSKMFTGVGGFFATVLFAPLNMAVNFVKDLFGWGDPGVPFDLVAEITTVATDIFDWFKGLFTIDFGAIKNKALDIGLMLKAMTAGGIAAGKVALNPFSDESAGETYRRVYDETMKKGQMQRDADEADRAMGLDPSKALNPYERKRARLDRKKDAMALGTTATEIPPTVIIQDNKQTNAVDNSKKSTGVYSGNMSVNADDVAWDFG